MNSIIFCGCLDNKISNSRIVNTDMFLYIYNEKN